MQTEIKTASFVILHTLLYFSLCHAIAFLSWFKAIISSICGQVLFYFVLYFFYIFVTFNTIKLPLLNSSVTPGLRQLLKSRRSSARQRSDQNLCLPGVGDSANSLRPEITENQLCLTVIEFPGGLRHRLGCSLYLLGFFIFKGVLVHLRVFTFKRSTARAFAVIK